MKKMLICLTVLMSMSAMASEVRVTGVKAAAAFENLQNQFEYSSGAKVRGLAITTVVRHDNGSISCSKETVQYGNDEAETTYECTIF